MVYNYFISILIYYSREGRGKYRGNANSFLGTVLNYLETPQ